MNYNTYRELCVKVNEYLDVENTLHLDFEGIMDVMMSSISSIMEDFHIEYQEMLKYTLDNSVNSFEYFEMMISKYPKEFKQDILTWHKMYSDGVRIYDALAAVGPEGFNEVLMSNSECVSIRDFVMDPTKYIKG